jgi:hypothetical protein
MDITTVNDRHLYEARVLVRDRGTPDGQADLAGRVIRFGPPGWLTVVDRRPDGVRIELYPTSQVLSVTELREVDAPGVSSFTA